MLFGGVEDTSLIDHAKKLNRYWPRKRKRQPDYADPKSSTAFPNILLMMSDTVGEEMITYVRAVYR